MEIVELEWKHNWNLKNICKIVLYNLKDSLIIQEIFAVSVCQIQNL